MIRGCRAAPRSERPESHRNLLSVQESSPDTRSILTFRHPWRLSHPSHRLSEASLASYQLPDLQTGQDKPICPGEQIIGGTWRIVAEDLGKGGARTTSPSMLCSVSAEQGWEWGAQILGGTWGALRAGTCGRFLWKTASCIMEPVVSDGGGGGGGGWW